MSSSSNPSISEDVDAGRDLPSFTPVRHRESGELRDKPESSASGSRRSAQSSTYDESPVAQSAEKKQNGITEGEKTNQTSGTVRRTRPHSSSGFLLDTALHPRRAFLSRSKKTGKLAEVHNDKHEPDVRGKRLREESEILLPKRRARDVKHAKASSIGGSPLATEIKQDTDNEGNGAGSMAVTATDTRRSTFSQAATTNNPSYGSSLAQSKAPASASHNIDPVQIVNMALSLNEKRRRQVSGQRVVSGQSIGTRPTSGAKSSQLWLGTQINPPRRTSQRVPMQTPNRNDMGRTSQIVDQQQQAFVGGPVVLDEGADATDTYVNLSHATELRVQKARTYFELAYEHRRLLSHLPPIRRPGASLQDASSKIYNPLQYSRNRKLRFSEKHPIASEAEGWHDVDQVHTWVDKVIEAHAETRHDPEECVRLSDLAYDQASDSEAEEDEEGAAMLLDSPTSGFREPSKQKAAKPRRPRSDWVFHPGDLIADAYWLEQGQNKLKIVDRDGNKIYPPNTRFKFSGWRNRTPVDVPERFQEPTPPPEQANEVRLPTPPPSALPELPTFTSTHKDKLRIRSRRKNIVKNTLGKDYKDALLDSGSSHTSGSVDGSDDERNTRGRKLMSRKRQKSRDNQASAESKLNSASDHHFSRKYGSSAEHSFDQSPSSSKRPSIDHSRLSKLFTRESRTNSSKNHSGTRSDSRRQESTSGPASRGSYEGGNAQRSSVEYDTTAPTSPTGVAFPSIAINLSPPASRSPSPSKKGLPSILNPFRDRSQGKIREGIDATDFSKALSRQHTHSEADPGHESSDHASRGTSPMTRPMSNPMLRAPTYNEPHGAVDEHRGSTVSKVSTKSANTDGHSKVRGIFKGGRIAEIVGNEVSKAGDYIWKRNVPSAVRRRDSSPSSMESYQASDADDEPYQNGFVYKNPSENEKRLPSSETDAWRVKKPSSSDSHSSPEAEGKTNTRYHNPNLPSFTSPFEKDRDTQDERKRNALSTTNSSEQQYDPITHFAIEHRSAIKSPRMDRLAPPKLTLSRSTSPHAPFTMNCYDRNSSYGYSDGDRDISRSRNASQVFNDALKSNGTMVTGLAAIDPTKSRSRSRVDLFRTVSHRSASSAAAEFKDVSKRDIAFTYALLLSSAIKAHEIQVRANAYRNPLPAFLLDTLEPNEATGDMSKVLNVKRKEEQIRAARNLITRLEKDGQRFQIKLQAFQSRVSPNLHRALQGLEDMVDNDLTPRVRKSGDEAGELSMKLSTTSTLAVKDANERIDAAMRRRRRGPVRWLRRFGYLCIEWVVVALLWGIWAVVTALRVVRAIAAFLVCVMRWLLFL